MNVEDQASQHHCGKTHHIHMTPAQYAGAFAVASRFLDALCFIWTCNILRAIHMNIRESSLRLSTLTAYLGIQLQEIAMDRIHTVAPHLVTLQ
jgi:hypothetical protein